MMAFSTAATMFFSHGVTTIVRASSTEMLAVCFIGHVRAVVLDHDVLEQPRVRAARAQAAHLFFEGLDAALHALLGRFLDVVDHLPVPVRGRWFMTDVPTGSPVTTRTRSPGLLRLNTMSGRLFSRHMTIAVASMTRRSSAST